MPETISYSFDVIWGRNRRTSFSDASTCRELAIQNLRSYMYASYANLSEMLEAELHPTATLTVSNFNEIYLHEIIDVLSMKGDVQLTIQKKDGYFSRNEFILTLSGKYALPAWYWTVLACRTAVLRTRKSTLMEAIQATDKYDSTCWFRARDQGSAWRAWSRTLKGIGPTSKQMIYFNVGPVHWYYTRGKNSIT